MANRERGEVAIEVEGRAYTLRPSFNSICELEGLLNKPFDVVMQDINEGRLSGVRSTLWCLMREHHRDEFPTLEAAGNWNEKVGLDRVRELLVSSMDANTEAATEGAKAANPPKAQAGTGGRSSSRRIKSA